MKGLSVPIFVLGWLAVASASAHPNHAPGPAVPIGPIGGAEVIDAGAVRQDYIWEEKRLAAESFWLPEAVAARLAALAVGERLEVAGFPVAPGERALVEFERYDVYAPGAVITVVDENGAREIPRSDRVHLLGVGVENPSVRIGLSIDPDGTRLTGTAAHETGTYDLYLFDADNPLAPPVYEIGRGLAKRLGIDARTSCDTPGHPQFFDPAVEAALAGGEPQPHTAGDLHLAVLAFDTDGELIQNMFAGSTVNTNTAIGDFVTASNVIYERDLSLRLQQGDTVLNSNPASDPYSATGTFAQLIEVEEWWAVNKVGVFRTFVALLSGKSPGNFSGSGIAWVGSYCNNGSVPAGFDGGSFSATQVLRGIPLNSSTNVGLLDHEIGHNAGSSHTHCYVPEIDQCYNDEGGCWAGAVSCPNWVGTIPGISADVGTMMSYCDFDPPEGAGCASSENFFHPTVIANIKGQVNTAHAGDCITHVATCTVGTNDLAVPPGSFSGTVTHQACNSITYANWTAEASADVTAQAPNVVLENGVSIIGKFTAQNVVP